MVLSIQRPPSGENKELPNSANYLLNLLPKTEFENLIANSHRVFFSPKSILHEPNEPIDRVYFPLRGIISLLNTSPEGLIAEVLTVSNEGLVGITAILGGFSFASFAVVQTDCIALEVDAVTLRKEFDRGGELQRILLRYTRALLNQGLQNVFCSCHHTIEQRLARWLLAFSDRLNNNRLLLTQETLADLLGVRRSSLSVVANDLRQRGLINYSRGRIIIKDRFALKKVACDCDYIITKEMKI